MGEDEETDELWGDKTEELIELITDQRRIMTGESRVIFIWVIDWEGHPGELGWQD